MTTLLNTLYVTTEGSYLHLDNETVRIEKAGETLARVPLHHLGSIVAFGNILVSPPLMSKCAREGRSIAFFDAKGRFGCRVEGPHSGNILLKKAQCSAAEDDDRSLAIARNIVRGKLRNTRTFLMRIARESDHKEDREALLHSANHFHALLRRLERTLNTDEVRGVEGEAAKTYFQSFNHMLKSEFRKDFRFESRSRRPPRDPMNALLSFLYTLLTHDAVSAIEGVGLDPREGFLHAIRPGRPALALDLIEEFRVMLADRLAIALIHRRQITMKEFEFYPGGAVLLTDKGRKSVLTAYQKKKSESINHPMFKERIVYGLLMHIQARLMARHLRGDLPDYPPMLFR